MKVPTSISVIIPTYNEGAYIGDCLTALMPQISKGDEVIVIDNNSADNTIDIAKGFKGVRVLTETQQGQIFAQRTGLMAAKNDLVARIDADTIVADNWLITIKARFSSAQAPDALSGPGYSYDTRFSYPARLMGFVTFTTNRFISGFYPLWGSNFAIKKSVWLDVASASHDRRELWEDFELGILLHDHGYKAAYEPALSVGYSARSVFQLSLWRSMAYQLRAPRTYWAHGYWAVAVASVVERSIIGLGAVPLMFAEYGLKVADKLHGRSAKTGPTGRP